MEGICWLCGNWETLERHHIFPGRANRPLSEKYNATVDLCPWCHRIDADAVHRSADTRKVVQAYGQRKVMREQGWTREEFMAVFGRAYDDGEDVPEPEIVDNHSFRELEPIPLFI